ncbi:MAG: TVP38/TMEM64 family protein [Roseiflexus sp.]|nr:TVP38/TMEM64 family protein [Roseiflexus sp.]MCS7288736.1 TVP38/TMEM64 family protein [Roseiflexus sp.]MDW8147281.1 TVP38/TMEM64 family protein [Roseiflexaceae bacterium]MDW8233578.1 TVP38/TMEM64 family protein [Roseiflexaceae bacterium]
MSPVPVLTRRALFLAGALSLVLLIIFIGWSGATHRVFSAASPDEAAAVLRGFGLWTPLVSVALMVLQSVLAPLPGSLIAAANGAIYGVWQGTLLSWVGGMAGGLVTYALGHWASEMLPQHWKDTPLWRRLTSVGASRGFWIVLIARMTPIVSLDFIGYLAGVARMPLPSYALANALGIIPGMLAYTLIGSELIQGRAISWQIALALILLVVLFVVGRRWLRAEARGERQGARGVEGER